MPRVARPVPVQRDEQDQSEGIGPEIAAAIRPDALGAHPGKLGEDGVDVLQRHGYKPNGQVSSAPGRGVVGSGVTAVVSSNHT
jgi:hypothetical protein